jgi:hypothetical protein
MAAGKIYDTEEVARIQGLIDMQTAQFIEDEKKQNVKQWVAYLVMTVVLTGTVVYFAMKKK